jgi:uncharacterized protein (TIGR03067 family)
VEEGGKKVPEEAVKAKDFVIVFAGDKVTCPVNGAMEELEYKLDPTAKPKRIDVIVEDGKIARGIYQLEGDTLKLCFDKDAGGERPTKFATDDTTYGLIVLKRKK